MKEVYFRKEIIDKKVSLFEQPPNSPDLNMLDLGLFNAIQSVYDKEVPKTYDDIIDLLKKAYWNYPPNMIHRLWLTRMTVMNEIIDCNGGNEYTLPHLGNRN